MSTVWRFVNVTTGRELECNDLQFLLYQVKEWGIILPEYINVDLILNSQMSYEVTDTSGNIMEIIIGEHSPERGIYFSKEPKNKQLN